MTLQSWPAFAHSRAATEGARATVQYEAPLGPLPACVDCDRHMRECACEYVLRCSCGLPDEVCVCAGKTA